MTTLNMAEVSAYSVRIRNDHVEEEHIRSRDTSTKWYYLHDQDDRIRDDSICILP